MIEQTIQGTGRVAVIGHRGANGYAPENTIASFEKAAALGVHAFECDVRLTRDGQVVVTHDAVVDRVSNGSGAVADMTLAELRRLDFGVRFPEYGVQRIPTLAECLDAAKRLDVDVVVEIKGDPEAPRALVNNTVALVVDAGLVDRCVVISFHHASLLWVKEEHSCMATGLLSGSDIIDPVPLALAFGSGSIRPHHSQVTPEMVAAAHAAGLCAHTWNSNDADLTRRLVAMGVDSLGSDKPDIVRQTLIEMGRLA